MRPPTSFKQDFLKKWAMGLEFCASSTKNMSLMERKNAIKLSSDVAMASARNGKTCWSRAIISKASKQQQKKDDDGQSCSKISLVNKILGSDHQYHVDIAAAGSNLVCKNKVTVIRRRSSSKKILRRSCSMGRMRKCAPKQRVLARTIAKRMVKKKTQVLKSLVPGGEFMDDEINLIEETLDYIFALRAQIDVMRRVVNASEASSSCK